MPGRSLVTGPLPLHQLPEEVGPLVVYQDEGREVLHLDPVDGFQARLRVFQELHLLDVLVGQSLQVPRSEGWGYPQDVVTCFG